jgi:hypothetical protein
LSFLFILFYFILILYVYSFHLLHPPNFCKAQRFSATIFQIRLSFGQAQRFGASIFHIRLGFCQEQRFGAVIFPNPPIFSSSAKVWRSNSQVHLFFHQAQRLGAVIFKSDYFSIKRKALAQQFSRSA